MLWCMNLEEMWLIELSPHIKEVLHRAKTLSLESCRSIAMDNMNDVAKYVYEMGYLKSLQRAGWAMIGIPVPETVAEHSFRAAILGFILATLEGADPLKTATIC